MVIFHSCVSLPEANFYYCWSLILGWYFHSHSLHFLISYSQEVREDGYLGSSGYHKPKLAVRSLGFRHQWHPLPTSEGTWLTLQWHPDPFSKSQPTPRWLQEQDERNKSSCRTRPSAGSALACPTGVGTSLGIDMIVVHIIQADRRSQWSWWKWQSTRGKFVLKHVCHSCTWRTFSKSFHFFGI